MKKLIIQKKIKFFSYVMVLCLLLQLIPSMGVVFAAPPPTPSSVYNTQKTTRAILNKTMAGDVGFMNKYVNANNLFNIIEGFGLSFGKSYVRTTGNYYYQLDSATKALQDANQLSAYFSASLTNDKHGNALNHPFSYYLAAPIVTLRQSDGSMSLNLTKLSTASKENYGSDGTWTLDGTANMAPEFGDTVFDRLLLKFEHTGCEKGCGDCSVKNLAVGLIDMGNPYVKRIYTTDENGKPVNGFSLDQQVRIHLQFNEPIRYANNNQPSGDVYLNLDVMDAATNQSVTGLGVRAKLYSLNNDTLSFYLNVPSKLGNGNASTNHYIYQLSENQPDLIKTGAFPLVWMTGSGNTMNPDFSGPGLSTSDTLVTDLAGNSFNFSGGRSFENKCRIDVLPPYVNTVTLTSDRIQQGEADQGEVYAGLGEKLTFSVQLNEKLYIGGQEIKSSTPVATLNTIQATLNLKNSGTDVALKCVAASLSQAVNLSSRTVLTFEPITITDTMTAVAYSGGASPQITILKLSSSSEIKDEVGNIYDSINIAQGAAGIPAVVSNRQKLLDIKCPITATNLQQSGGKYAPVLHQSGNYSSFYIPITISDEGSGYQGAIGSIMLKNIYSAQTGEFPFQYAVTGTASMPASTLWKQADTGQKVPFTQLSTDYGGNYIHIRLIDTQEFPKELYTLVDPTLIVYPRDYVQNEGEDQFALSYNADFSGPAISMTADTSFDSGSNTGTINAHITITDFSKVSASSIQYQFVNRGATPSGSWSTYTGGGGDNQSITFTATKGNLPGGELHEYDLYVRAADATARANGSEQKFDVRLDANLPNLEITAYDTVQRKAYLSTYLSDAGKYQTAMILVKDPRGDGSQYFMSTVNGFLNSSNAVLISTEVSNLWKTMRSTQNNAINSDLSQWYYVKLMENGQYTLNDNSKVDAAYGFLGGQRISDMLMRKYSNSAIPKFNQAFSSAEDEQAAAMRCRAIMDGKYYGDLDVMILYGNDMVMDFSNSNKDKSWAIPLGPNTSKSLSIYERNLSDNNQPNFVSQVKYGLVRINESYDETADMVGGWLYYDVMPYHQVQAQYGLEPCGCIDGDKHPYTITVPRDEVPLLYLGIDYIPKNAIVARRDLTLRAGAHSGEVALVQDGTVKPAGTESNGVLNPSSTPTFEMTMTPFTAMNQAENTNDKTLLAFGKYTGTLNEGESPYLKSIAGSQLRIDIKANFLDGIEDWTFANIDFAGSKAELFKCDADGTPTGAAVHAFPFTAGLKNQMIVIPADVDQRLTGGRYAIVASLKTASGETIKKTYNNIYVDRTATADFGMAGTVNIFDNGQNFKSTVTQTFWHPSGTPSEWGREAYIAYYDDVMRQGSVSFCAADREVNPEGGFAFSIKVWNATNSATEAANRAKAQFREITLQNEFEFIYDVVGGPGYESDAAITNAHGTKLPLYRGENIIHYQGKNANGEFSDVRTVIIHFDTNPVDFDVNYDISGHPVRAVNAKPVTSDAFPVYYYTGDMSAASFDLSDPANRTQVDLNTGYDMIRDGKHLFFTINEYGVPFYKFIELPAGTIDRVAPVITSDTVEFKPGYIVVGLSTRLGSSDAMKDLTLYIERFVVQGGVETAVENSVSVVRAPATTDIVMLSSKEPTPDGIIKIYSRYGAYNLDTIEFQAGTVPTGSGQLQHNRWKVYAEDQAGNRSAVKVLDFNQPDTYYDYYEDAELTQSGQIQLNFNALVQIKRISKAGQDVYSGLDDKFETSKIISEITADGIYDVTFIDALGNQYTKSVDISIFGDFWMDVSYSTLEPTNQDVIVTISTLANDKITLKLPGNMPSDVYAVISGDKKVITATVRKNTTFDVILNHTNSGSLTRAVSVSNIDKTPPSAELYWYFEEWGITCKNSDLIATLDHIKQMYSPQTDTEGKIITTGQVKSWLVSDESITLKDGGEVSYIFAYQGQESFIYEYIDRAGNNAVNPIKATLPVILAMSPAPDTDAPEYSVTAYITLMGKLQPAGNFGELSTVTDLKPLNAAAMSLLGYAQSYRFSFTLYDASSTRIALLNTASPTTEQLAGVTYAQGGDTINGVTASGNNVNILQPGDPFTIVFVDAKDNRSYVTATRELVDIISPQATVQQTRIGDYLVKLKVTLSDNNGKEVQFVSKPADMKQSADSGNILIPNEYEMNVLTNQTISLLFRDSVGNTGSETIQVTGITSSIPSGTIRAMSSDRVSWTPGAGGVIDIIPNDPAKMYLLNTDLSILIDFNRSVKNIKIYQHNGNDFVELTGASNDDAALSVYGEAGAGLIVRDSGYFKLTFASLNDISGSMEMRIPDAFDRISPVINDNSPNVTSGSYSHITLNFTANETVLDEEGTKHVAGTEIKKTITQNGVYSFMFSDCSGNTVSITKDVKNIDPDPPLIVVEPLTTTPAQSTTVSVKMSRPGTVTMFGQTKTITKGWTDDSSFQNADSATFTVTQNGSYLIEGKSQAGWITKRYVGVSNIDTIPPYISLGPVTLSIREGSSDTELKTLLDSGASVTDNVTPEPNMTITYDSIVVDLSTPGLYAVRYEATDTAGNVGSNTRYIRVYSKDEILVHINDIKTSRESTTLIKTSGSQLTVRVSIGNLNPGLPNGDAEPYKVYIRTGIKTAGQMKLAPSLAGSTFNANEGYYTLYVVTQSRKSYLTYFYIQP